MQNTWNARKKQSPVPSKYAEERYQKFKNALSKMHTNSVSPEAPQLKARLKLEKKHTDPKKKEEKR